MDSIETLIESASHDMFNPGLNFNIALKYEELGQTAAAISFYLRAAEYGYDEDEIISYTSLLKIANCFNTQKGRESTVTKSLMQAIQYMPTRPEAYFLLSRFYEQEQKWQESYTFAELGLLHKSIDTILPGNVGYPGEYGLIFEKAVSSWWIGRKDESALLFNKLLSYDLSSEYMSSVKYNLGILS